MGPDSIDAQRVLVSCRSLGACSRAGGSFLIELCTLDNYLEPPSAATRVDVGA